MSIIVSTAGCPIPVETMNGVGAMFVGMLSVFGVNFPNRLRPGAVPRIISPSHPTEPLSCAACRFWPRS